VSALIVLLYPFIVLSALGLMLSMVAHVAAILGLHVPPESIWLFFGNFVVFIPTLITSILLMPKGYGRKDFWRMTLRGAPKWMHYMTYGFFIYFWTYVIIILFTSVIFPRNNLSNIDNLSSPSVRDFSSICLVFYSTSLSILYSATQIEKKGFRWFSNRP
jgi:hypothetical protein